MGLVTRNGNVYYYENWREGGRVRSEYVGSGVVAQIAQQRAESKAVERSAFAQQSQEMRALSLQVDGAVDDLMKQAEAELIASGFYKHKGQWRKKRHG